MQPRARSYFVISVRQLSVPVFMSKRVWRHWNVEIRPDHGLWSQSIYSGHCPKVAAKAAIMTAESVFDKGYGFFVDGGADNDNGWPAPTPCGAA